MISRFIVRLLIFSLPVALVLSSPVILAIYVGEAMPLEMIVALQAQDETILYNTLTLDDYTLAYKLLAVRRRQPEIIVIGSSRMLGFRSWMADKRPSAFYNAAAPRWGFNEINTFIEALDSASAPRILIIGLDQPWFNAVLDPTPFTRLRLEDDWSRVVQGGRDMLGELLHPGFSRSRIITRKEPVYSATGLGLETLASGYGYRADGSYQLGPLLQDPFFQTHTKDHYDAPWQARTGVLTPGSVVSGEMLARLDALLAAAQARNIFVVGVAPPYMVYLVDKMQASGEYSYLTALTPAATDIFERHGFRYFDFLNPQSVGGSDDEMYDGWHPGELLSLRMYLTLLENLPDVLGEYSDRASLYRIAQEAANPFEVLKPLPTQAGN